MRLSHLCALLPLALSLAGCGSSSAPERFVTTNTNVGSTTTLASQTINNTSAAVNFPSQSNGNLGANNVSKVNVHSLLYPGNNTKVLAQLLVWFGQSDHMNVGYSSTDPAQVERQIADMVSRGIDGVLVDWYGPNNAMDQATQLVMHEAEKHPGFSFGIMIDAGAVGSVCGRNCSSPQQALISLLQYVEKNYFVSPAYLNIGGQPVITHFNIDYDYQVDWVAVNAQLQVPPRFFFQDNDGFRRPMSDGSYAWVMPQFSDDGFGYLQSFYNTGLSFSGKETVGAAYKGFDDSLAPWGSRRRMDQQCGQTWLQTFAQVNNLYSSSHQITWNDYEEGTEIESGIDDCFSLQASIVANTLNWTIKGNENVVDHFNVYSSTDGQNLTALAQTKPGVHAVNLCRLPIPPGQHQLFVQAVGKPSFANRMPAPVNYTPACRN